MNRVLFSCRMCLYRRRIHTVVPQCVNCIRTDICTYVCTTQPCKQQHLQSWNMNLSKVWGLIGIRDLLRYAVRYFRHKCDPSRSVETLSGPHSHTEYSVASYLTRDTDTHTSLCCRQRHGYSKHSLHPYPIVVQFIRLTRVGAKYSEVVEIKYKANYVHVPLEGS